MRARAYGRAGPDCGRRTGANQFGPAPNRAPAGRPAARFYFILIRFNLFAKRAIRADSDGRAEKLTLGGARQINYLVAIVRPAGRRRPGANLGAGRKWRVFIMGMIEWRRRGRIVSAPGQRYF